MFPALIAAAAPAVINALGRKSAGKDGGSGYDAAALAAIDQVGTPNLQDLKYKLDRLIQQGQITPEQAQTILANPTAYTGMKIDPTAKAAQMKALAQMAEISDEGGMTIADKAALNRVQTQTAGAARGSREAILQHARERGASGGGVELVAQLMNAQGAATDANQSGLDIAAQSRERALEALMATGQMGGQIRGQEFEEAARAAEAKDAIEKFNAANKQNVVNANVDRRNAASAVNLSEKQRVSDTNVGLVNDERKIAADAYQTDFDNRLKKAAARAGQLGSMADAKRDAQDRKNAFTGSVLSTGGQVLSGYLAGRDKK
jgi:hypothetical protein